jgi:hypothetical protein
MVWPSMGGHRTQGAMLGSGRGRVNESTRGYRCTPQHQNPRFSGFPSLLPRWFGGSQILSPFSAASRPLFWRVGSVVSPYSASADLKGSWSAADPSLSSRKRVHLVFEFCNHRRHSLPRADVILDFLFMSVYCNRKCVKRIVGHTRRVA